MIELEFDNFMINFAKLNIEVFLPVQELIIINFYLTLIFLVSLTRSSIKVKSLISKPVPVIVKFLFFSA